MEQRAITHGIARLGLPMQVVEAAIDLGTWVDWRGLRLWQQRGVPADEERANDQCDHADDQRRSFDPDRFFRLS
ncbi:hypothetical protein [Nonomuraea sp. SYSU D8015]|uniref:hypothetical protein n=1 Tax=Nonomuraea sp. SYSU D8015 TaxID=2593644 RepID=UPI0016612D3E|nr:hypothetical protein [Nonomuraea sp. SYSU D8015]